MLRYLSTLMLSFLFLYGCAEDEAAKDFGMSSPATEQTAAINQAGQDAALIQEPEPGQGPKRGLIASPESLIIRDDTGRIIWNLDAYDFVAGTAPDTVNPGLWQQATRNGLAGLFKVVPGIYQLRGFDLANMTLIESQSGWIVVDPLTTPETAKAALEFARYHLGNKDVIAIIITHSHIDHFGGVSGIMELSHGSGDTSRAMQIPVIAPEGFVEEATSENIVAGRAMSRRSMYMYGLNLPRHERGHIGSGLGKEPAIGKFSMVKPDRLIKETGETLGIDGVDFFFQIVSGSEAPAELTFYLPEKRAFCGAELVSQTLHNLYTLRGAKVRDGLLWSRFIQESMDLFAEADSYFGSHHWPVWGREEVRSFLISQRDTYRYIHDQTVRLMNAGYVADEIAEMIQLPQSLRETLSSRGYYGSLKHNIKAVYQWYMGWYNGNPAYLDPLPASASAERYVALMGGEEAVMEAATDAFDEGDYRWTAELLNKLMFTDPGHSEAAALLANTYDQLGYQAESAPWRDNYLSAAFELRHGEPEQGVEIKNMIEIMRLTPLESLFTAMAVGLNGVEAEEEHYTINITFPDRDLNYVLWIENAVLHYRQSSPSDNASASMHITQDLFVRLMLGDAGIKDILLSDDIEFAGSKLDLIGFFSLFDKPVGNFAIVRP